MTCAYACVALVGQIRNWKFEMSIIPHSAIRNRKANYQSLTPNYLSPFRIRVPFACSEIPIQVVRSYSRTFVRHCF